MSTNNNNLLNKLEETSANENAQNDNQTVIEVRHLSKTFGNNQVLRDIDFNVKKGDVTCIIVKRVN